MIKVKPFWSMLEFVLGIILAIKTRVLKLIPDVIKEFSDFIWDSGKLPFPSHLGKYFIKIGKIRAKIHEIGKIKAIFGLGMTPIYGLKNGQIKSLELVLSIKRMIITCFTWFKWLQLHFWSMLEFVSEIIILATKQEYWSSSQMLS